LSSNELNRTPYLKLKSNALIGLGILNRGWSNLSS
jgi:hypothetical protein